MKIKGKPNLIGGIKNGNVPNVVSSLRITLNIDIEKSAIVYNSIIIDHF